MPEALTFADRYRAALVEYAAMPGESGRSAAYALGREAVEAGMSVLDLAVLHQQATESVVEGADSATGRRACGQFYLEALSTFDMVQRGYWEAQERARAERTHGDRLARLNEAVVSISSIAGYADRLSAIAFQSEALAEADASVLFVDDTEFYSRPVDPSMTAEIRLAAAKARLNERSTLDRVGSRSDGVTYLLSSPVGLPGQTGSGAVTLCRDHPFTEEEIAIVEQFARYSGMALNIAARFEEEHELAIALQRAFLPPVPPAVPGMSVAWRYLPAEARDIGGDWYDVFNLDSGEAVLVVGDVMGHDLRAAAIMGQLRLALQAYAIDGYEPADVLDRADRLLQRLDPTSLATVSYAVVEPGRRRLRLSNAGHPPPLLRTPDGEVSLLTGGLSVPLGTDMPSSRHRGVEYDLEPGAQLVLYTDGLVEDRLRGFEEGITALIAVAREDTTPLDDLCERALSVRGQTREDDVCVLCVAVD